MNNAIKVQQFSSGNDYCTSLGAEIGDWSCRAADKAAILGANAAKLLEIEVCSSALHKTDRLPLTAKREIPVRQQFVYLLDIESFDLVGAQRTPRLTRHQILDA